MGSLNTQATAMHIKHEHKFRKKKIFLLCTYILLVSFLQQYYEYIKAADDFQI
jgi:hypothetical protein